MNDKPNRLLNAGILLLAIALWAGPAAAQTYDRTFRDDFMKSCIAEGGTYTICQCSMLQIESQIPAAQFLRMRQAVRSGGKADKATMERYDKIIAGCVAREAK